MQSSEVTIYKGREYGIFFSWLSLRNWLLTVRVMLCEATALKPNVVFCFFFALKILGHLKLGQEAGARVSGSGNVAGWCQHRHSFHCSTGVYNCVTTYIYLLCLS